MDSAESERKRGGALQSEKEGEVVRKLCSAVAFGFLAVLLVGGCVHDSQPVGVESPELFSAPGAFFVVVPDTITFEGLPAGTILASVSGKHGAGPVAVEGYNPYLGMGTNAAVVFDSDNPTGNDPDLGTPNENFGGPGIGLEGEAGPYANTEYQHEILIVAEYLTDTSPADGLVDDPNDVDAIGSKFTFDFSAVGTGVVTVHSITVIDVEIEEEDPVVSFYDDTKALLGSFVLPHTGNNGVAYDFDLGPTAGVVRMEVELNGSGAIDNIVFTPGEEPPPGDEGCTLGYWKNHTDDWVGYTTGQTVQSVFSAASAYPAVATKTLHQALKFGGGPGAVGGAKILLKQAVAAVLNAAHPDVEYPRLLADVISDVNAALASGIRSEMTDLGEDLDDDNKLGCPLSGPNTNAPGRIPF